MSVEQFFHTKGIAHTSILTQVHQLILDMHPGIQSSIKYTVPFYSLKKNVFYLDVQKGVPILGIVEGYRLMEIKALLDFTKRKQIGHFQLVNMNEERYELLIMVIKTAIDFDLGR